MRLFRKPLIFCLVFAVTALASPAYAITSRVGTADDLGVGVALGQPMGLTSKFWLSSTLAVDGFMGYHWNHNFDAHLDYLWHSYSSFNVSSGRLPFYAGLGGRILLGNSSQLAMRIPFGASYLFPNDPIETFVEVAPVIRVLKGIGTDIDGLVGVRVYINYMK
jgi:hypothetical protein